MVKNPPAYAGGSGLIPGLGRVPWWRKWQPTPVFLLGESCRQKSLRCCSPWGCKRVGHDLETEQQLSQTAGRMSSFCSKDGNSPRSLREGFLKTVLVAGIVGGVISLYTIL